ncbi:putative archaetidylserine decarboxylase proenzyme, partial [Bienertia sinuspersici]
DMKYKTVAKKGFEHTKFQHAKKGTKRKVEETTAYASGGGYEKLKPTYSPDLLWREEFDVPDSQQSAYLRQVLNRIESLVEGGEVFKRYFIVYCLGVFLQPRANGMIDAQVLRAVEDVDMIFSFNCCQYVLLAAVREEGYISTGVGVGSSSTGIDENVIKLLIPKDGLTDSQIQESGKNIDEIVASILAFKAEISQAFVPPNATNNLQSNGGNNEDGAGLNQNNDVEKSTVLEKECEDNGFGCSIDCRPCDAFVLYLSIFMRENQQYFTKWPKHQKEICDYCLLDDEVVDLSQRRGRLPSSLADFNAKKSDLQDVLARQQKKEEARRIKVEEKKRAINEKNGKVGVQKEKKKTVVADKKTRKM